MAWKHDIDKRKSRREERVDQLLHLEFWIKENVFVLGLLAHISIDLPENRVMLACKKTVQGIEEVFSGRPEYH